MRYLPRLVIVGGLGYLCIVLAREGQRYQAREGADPGMIFVFFGAMVLLAIIAAVIIALTFLPLLGDKIAQMIYGGGETEKSDPHERARVRIEAGDYAGALECYRHALIADPDDTAAIGEIVDVQCRYLGEFEAADGLLNEALERTWPADELAFLRCKLAEVQGQYLGHVEHAREILRLTIIDSPGTLYAKSAEKMLADFDRRAAETIDQKHLPG